MNPLRPPLVSRTQATFANAIAPVAPAVNLAVAGRPGTLLWEWREAPFEPVAALDLAVDGMPALVLLDSDPVAALVDLPLAAADLAELPPSFQASLVAEAMAELIQQVTARTGLAPDARALLAAGQIAEAPLLAERDVAEVGWRIVGEDGQIRLRGSLRLSANLARRLIELAQDRPAADGGLAVDELPLTGRVELGRTWLSAAELGGLEPHDVVLIRRHQWDQDLVTIIISADLRYTARVADSALTIVAEEAVPSNEENEAQPSERALSDLEEVSVPVTFDLGQLDLTIGELRRVREGYVVNLQRPLDGAVALRVNGRLIGRGELVDIEGSLGVRVIEIFPRDHG